MGARVLMVAVLLLACAGSSSQDSPEGYPPPGRQRLRGFMVWGSELHAYQMCGGAELTWVELQGWEPGLGMLGLVPNCYLPDGGPAGCARFPYIELDATVSGPCKCGHLGKLKRKLDINEVLLVSQTAPPDCPHVDPHYPQ